MSVATARSITGYTLEPEGCERIALARYLGVDEIRVDETALAAVLDDASREPAVLIASDPRCYARLIENARRDIVLIHVADEAYDVSRARIYLNRKIKLVVRNYKVFPLPFLLRAALKWPWYAAKWMRTYWRPQAPWEEKLRHCKRMLLSRRYLLRQIRFAYLIRRMPGQVVDFPLNATSAFYYAREAATGTKKINVSFAGSVHSSERACAKETAAALGYGLGFFEWGGFAHDAPSADEYCRLLLSSYFTLSPTGHVNLDCFRFYEAISADALPLLPDKTPFQPFGYLSLLYDIDPRLLVPSFSRAHVERAIAAIAAEERPVLLERIRTSVEARNRLARQALENALNGV